MNNSSEAHNLSTPTRNNIVLGCPVDSEVVGVLKAVAYVVIIVVSLAGNTAVIIAVRRDKVMNQTINLYIANICTADLVITVVYLPRTAVKHATRSNQWLVEGTLGTILCKMVPYIYHVSVIASILTLLALAIDRSLAVFYPLKRRFTIRKTRESKIAILLIWVTAFITRSPSFVALTLKKSRNSNDMICSSSFSNLFDNYILFRQIYYTLLLVVFYLIPLVLTCALYVRIIIHFRAQQKRDPRLGVVLSQASTHELKFRRAGRKTSIMLVSVSVAFALCWGLHFFAQVVYSKVPCDLRMLRMLLANINCAVSPCVFFALNPHYRRLLQPSTAITRMFSENRIVPNRQLQPRSAIIT